MRYAYCYNPLASLAESGGHYTSPPPVQGRFLVGELTDETGKPYIILVNKDLNNSFRHS